MANAILDRQQLQSHTIEDTEEVITVGDIVRMNSSEMYGRPPFVARVKEISAHSNRNVSMYVRWYLKPEDTIGYRHEFHGEKELILTNLFKSQAGSNIQEKCSANVRCHITLMFSCYHLGCINLTIEELKEQEGFIVQTAIYNSKAFYKGIGPEKLYIVTVAAVMVSLTVATPAISFLAWR